MDKLKWELTEKTAEATRVIQERDRMRIEVEALNKRAGELTADRTKLTAEVDQIQSCDPETL